MHVRPTLPQELTNVWCLSLIFKFFPDILTDVNLIFIIKVLMGFPVFTQWFYQPFIVAWIICYIQIYKIVNLSPDVDQLVKSFTTMFEVLDLIPQFFRKPGVGINIHNPITQESEAATRSKTAASRSLKRSTNVE